MIKSPIFKTSHIKLPFPKSLKQRKKLFFKKDNLKFCTSAISKTRTMESKYPKLSILEKPDILKNLSEDALFWATQHGLVLNFS